MRKQIDIEDLKWLERYKVARVLPPDRNPLVIHSEPVERAGKTGKSFLREVFYAPATYSFYMVPRFKFFNLPYYISFPGEPVWALATEDQKTRAIESLLSILNSSRACCPFSVAVPEWSEFLIPMLRVKFAEITIDRMFPGDTCQQMLNPAWVIKQGELQRYDLGVMIAGFKANNREDLGARWLTEMI